MKSVYAALAASVLFAGAAEARTWDIRPGAGAEQAAADGDDRRPARATPSQSRADATI